MRTTVMLGPRLMTELKEHAAEQGISVRALVKRAVREFLRTSQPPAGSRPFELVTFGAGGRSSRSQIGKASALLADDDLVRFRPAGTSSPAEWGTHDLRAGHLARRREELAIRYSRF